MDMNDLEKEVFSKVKTIDYYTTVLKIKGLKDMPVGFYYIGEYMDDPATIGNPVAMQRFYADTDIFLFWSYGNSADIEGSTVSNLAIKAVQSMGGEVENVVLQRRFKYFPYVSNQDMKDGFYDRFETELQECGDRSSKELGELPGVEFPDLSTLDGYLKHWGTHTVTQNKILYIWINEEVVIGQRTYAELNANASCIAHKILTNTKPVIKPGDRVLLVFVPGLDFIDAFFGCSRARVLQVPVLPPDPLQRGRQTLLKIENIAKSSNAKAILSTNIYHSAVWAGLVKNIISLAGKNGKSSGRWPNLQWLHTDSWIKNFKNELLDDIVNQSEPQPDNLCFLQFTSGSTGDAKGVMFTYGGLIHNVKLMRRRYKSTSKTAVVSWLPQYHGMGLIGGIFIAMVRGGSAILFSPMTFIRNPLMWLQTMSKYKATHSAGPNFAFELIVRRLESEKNKVRKYDLSSMIFLMVAAEPVRLKTMKRFIELTFPFGLTQEVMAPGYGLAENCVFVSCAFGEGKPIFVDWQGRVCCGYIDSGNGDVDNKIVDPETGEELKEAGKEGEIWITSPRLGLVIGAGKSLASKHLDMSFKITRNIYSADVEKTMESTSELLHPGCCAVIGFPEEVLSAKGISIRDGSDQVGLVVIAEIRDGKPVDNDVVEEIKTRVTEEHGVSVASVKLIKPKTISKTKPGKIKRFDCLNQLAGGTLNTVPDPIFSKKKLLQSFTTGTCKDGFTPRPQTASIPLLTSFLKGLVSELTGIPIKNVSETEILVSYGIDSIGVVRAAQKLSDFLGVPIGAVDIFTATCIADLASFSGSLIVKSQPQLLANSGLHPETGIYSDDLMAEVTTSHQVGIWILQFLALISVSFMLSIPAYASVSSFMSFISASHTLTEGGQWLHYIVPLAFAPFAWILCIFLSCLCIALVQKIASTVLAEHLRGTVFLNYWFEMLGARIGSSVLLDSVDIADPSLVSIGDSTLIAEGTLIQSHEVRNGILSFLPNRIARNSSVGPYAIIQKGTVLQEESEVLSLQKTEEGKFVSRSTKAGTVKSNVSYRTQNKIISQIMGIYMVGFLSTLSSAILSFFYIWISQSPVSLQQFTFLCILGAFRWIPFTAIAYVTMFSHIASNPASFVISTALTYLAHGLILSFLTSTLTHLLRTLADFATWLLCGLAASKQHVKRVPHIRDAVWTLIRFTYGQEMYVKFKLRPYDESINEDTSKVEPTAILPQETGAIPTDEKDSLPLLFLAEDFNRRVNCSGDVRYIFQLQVRPIPEDETIRNIALDCTKPWGEAELPYINIGLHHPLRASIDHGRSLIYEICQHLRNKEPLPEAWRIFLEQSDEKVNLSGCPMAAALETKETEKLTPARTCSLCSSELGSPLKGLRDSPRSLVASGILASLICVVANWVLVGKKKEDKTVQIWSKGVFANTIWQAFTTLVGDCFMEMTSGSVLFVLWMKLMGSHVELDQGVYVDSMGALLNPEMVREGCVGREALLFGHIYEGEGRKVKFRKIRIGEGGFVGSRAVVTPVPIVESGGSLSALSLAMKNEIVK
ncbi:hypothetical protein SLEP1_g7649 [Rubroshorea leprosula]|uniref:Carrier domain-containing protein n=1 Tax=Rubroshorea leprosula TaxID=152421 RepID=A0AAV5I3Q2_9ROSI|nr:hypothetical protein SLEP1_g7649 [Rubroshorea leprosula]